MPGPEKAPGEPIRVKLFSFFGLNDILMKTVYLLLKVNELIQSTGKSMHQINDFLFTPV